AFHILFTSSAHGEATATVYRAPAAAARATGAGCEAVIGDAPVSMDSSAGFAASNGYRFFAGLRSDPHFKDVKGFQNDFQFTGDDPVAKRNVFGIVLEAPNASLGPAPIRLWARTMTDVHGQVTQADQAGRPGVNNAL